MLTTNTLTLLKSLTGLNNSMVISEKMTGSDEFKNINYLVDLSVFEDDIPEFGIFDVKNFIDSLELLDFENAQITYDPETKRIKAKDNNTSLEYITSDPSSLDYVQVKPEVITSTLAATSLIEVDLSKNVLQNIKKAAGVFKNFDTLNITKTDTGAELGITNMNTFSKNNNSWSTRVSGDVLSDKEFTISLPLDSLMKIPQMDFKMHVKYNPDRDAYRVVLTNEIITFLLSLKND